jgi:uncharacterized protein (TIGR00369 family)
VTIDGYPPTRHFLSELGMEAEVLSEASAKVRMRVTSHVVGADGGVRAGVLATLVDVVGGSAALRALSPDWLATADLTLQVLRPAVGPIVEARASVLRKGRTTLVVESLVFNVAEDGSDIVGDDGTATPVAWSTMTFAVLPASSNVSTRQVSSDLPDRWSFTGAGLDMSVLDTLPITVIDAGQGRVSLSARQYLFNSFGAVQGGVMALLAEVAATEMLDAARGSDALPVVVTDLQVVYLALGRVGPIVSRSRLLDVGSGTSGGSVVVDLLDQGADGRLTTVINVGAASVDSIASGAVR